MRSKRMILICSILLTNTAAPQNEKHTSLSLGACGQRLAARMCVGGGSGVGRRVGKRGGRVNFDITINSQQLNCPQFWIVDPVSVLSCEKKRRDMWLLYVPFVVQAVLPQLLEAIWSSWSPLLEQASPKFITKNFVNKFLPKLNYLFQKQQTCYP